MATSEVISGLVWTEKYRPSSLGFVAMEEGDRQTFQQYLEAGEVPHLLFIGPAGSGKTTVARILYNALDASVLELNASAERGIDVVRDKISAFASSNLGTSLNIVFLDEADALTSDAQTALRNLIEAYAEHTRFILTANYGHRIIDAIHSRCSVFQFGRPPLKERYRVLGAVLTSEGISAPKPVILSYAEQHQDMRKMLSAAQQAWLASGRKELPSAAVQSAASGDQMLRDLLAKNWHAFRRLTTSPDFDAQQAMRELFWVVPEDHAKAGRMRVLLAKAIHESGFTPDVIILFLGAIADLMEGM